MSEVTRSNAAPRPRVTSIDLLRGVVIVLMALDHMRDFIHVASDPTNLATTTIPLFATRWITHFCAPVFMLLAGVGAALQLERGMSRRELSRFLVTRGLWLIVLELTVIRCTGWFFNVDYEISALSVIWALGISMIALAALLWLPPRLLLAISIAGIAGHNLLDAYEPDGKLDWLYQLAHVPGLLAQADGRQMFLAYPVVPWVFVMALGFAIAPVFRWEPARRQRALLVSGGALLAAFVVIRGIELYGDPLGWSVQPQLSRSVMSFLHCEKYPPSLCFLLMTLGPALIALALLERRRGRIADVFAVFGRVPMFFYLLHLPAIHGAALALALTRYDAIPFMFTDPFAGYPPGYGYPLWFVYVVWIAIVLALYPLCRWFAGYKRAHRAWWLSYL